MAVTAFRLENGTPTLTMKSTISYGGICDAVTNFNPTTNGSVVRIHVPDLVSRYLTIRMSKDWRMLFKTDIHRCLGKQSVQSRI